MTAIAASIFTPQINRPCLLVLFSPCALNRLSHLPDSLKKGANLKGLKCRLAQFHLGRHAMKRGAKTAAAQAKKIRYDRQ
ncbi:MAG: hypothetical protein ACFNZS_02090 [Ottowia sp.]